MLKNWKTTLAGAAVVILTGLKFTGKLPSELCDWLIGIVSATGLALASDAGNPPNPPTLETV